MSGLDIAIIGCGAAGMTCAYLLDEAHRVTAFERAPVIGGNVCTLNGNVPCPGLDPALRIDAGVIEFCANHFPSFHKLLARLGVETVEVPATTGFIDAGGGHLRAPGKLAAAPFGWRARAHGWARLLPLAPALLAFRRRATAASHAELSRRSLDDYLGDGKLAAWLRLLMVYAYSQPLAAAGAMPAALTVPTLLQFTGRVRWTSIPGGAYRYLQRIHDGLRGRVITGATVTAVSRGAAGVTVRLAGAEPMRFDKVVFATTPEQVLPLLADAGDDERRRFGGWQSRQATVLIHHDDGLYRRRNIHDYSEFDVFARPAGYNAYLNRLCGVPPEHPRHYHLSYGLDAEIAPARVLHRQRHAVPRYTVAALATRDAILAHNGANHTFYAGAWLGNGLHEGAVESALRVAGALGGRRL